MNHYKIIEKVKFKYVAFAVIACCILSGLNGYAQTKAELKAAKKLYAGSWVNKLLGIFGAFLGN